MKKLTFKISLFLLVAALLVVILLIYIRPQEQLDLSLKPINIDEKLDYMINNFKTELVLSEDDIDTIIKSQLDRTIQENLVIEGAKFYVENSVLHAKLNVKYRNQIDAVLFAEYLYEVNNRGALVLEPLSLHLKDIPLPTSMLKTFSIPLFNVDESIIQIKEIKNVGRDIVVKWKIDLF